MSKITLEALTFVGMVHLEPHIAGQMITDNVGTDKEPEILKNLREYEIALLDYRCRKTVTDIIDAFKAR